jgi:hypothetical protein
MQPAGMNPAGSAGQLRRLSGRSISSSSSSGLQALRPRQNQALPGAAKQGLVLAAGFPTCVPGVRRSKPTSRGAVIFCNRAEPGVGGWQVLKRPTTG